IRKAHSFPSLIKLIHNLTLTPCVRRGVMVVELDLLRKEIETYQDRKAPGVVAFYNIICFKEHGLDCNSLLLSHPSKLVDIVKKIQRGDEESSKIILKLLFLTPIEEALSTSGITDDLWELIKQGRDEEFVKIIKQLFERRISKKQASGVQN
ncbi:MAG: hypothetical protein QXE81_06380, partial [Desulfurococcaceae archaeon]